MAVMGLERGLAALSLDLKQRQRQQLNDYLTLLARWNRSYNLTAVRDPDAMVVRHLLDSLVLIPELHGDHLIDVGTGAGLPGIPLAIACPERHFTLLDSNGKKTRFLFQALNHLGLDNCVAVKSRVEDYHPTQAFDVVVSRAFASLGDMIAGCSHLLAPGGTFLAMKGQVPEPELSEVPATMTVLDVVTLQVPGLDEERCVVRIGHSANP